MSTWEAWQAANPGACPGSANPGPFFGNARAFFRETMIRGYGLHTVRFNDSGLLGYLEQVVPRVQERG